MKKYSFIFLLLPFLFSCSKDVEPDLASAFVGNYNLTEHLNDASLHTVWKVTKRDNNHVDIVIQGDMYFQNSPERNESSIVSITNVLVELENVLSFDNKYQLRDETIAIKGKASITGHELTYSVSFIDESGDSEYASKKLTRSR